MSTLQTVSLVDLQPSVNNVRPQSDEHVDLLAESIRTYGLLHPITVQLIDGGKYEVLAGARRVLALQRLNVPTVLANVVTNVTDPTALSFAENIQRHNMLKQDVCKTIVAALARNENSVQRTAQYLQLHPNTVKRYALISQLDSATLARLDAPGDDHLTLAAAEKMAVHKNNPNAATGTEGPCVDHEADQEDGEPAEKKARKKGVKTQPWIYDGDNKPMPIPEPLYTKVLKMVTDWDAAL